ncbi:MAG: DUF6261 family protein [Tannerella sp.]|jgi:hypothetical protein|nr:DUF6261 family protein [Tannerella sp.]
MKTFVSLKVGNLTLDNLAGLCGETILVAGPIVSKAGQLLLTATFNKLSADNAEFDTLIDRSRKSPLTPEIHTLDDQCGEYFEDIRRALIFFEKSKNPVKLAAAKLLMPEFEPAWNLTSEPLSSQLVLLETLRQRIPASGGPLIEALATLELDDTWLQLISASTLMQQLYTQRLTDNASDEFPAASGLKATLVKDYDRLCANVEQNLDVMPTPEIEILFHEMNELRRKYIHRLPKDIGAGDHLVFEPIATQAYTGKAVTPLPKLHYREEGQPTVELVFTKDFFVTYKHNVDVGSARIFIHGKGAYKGQTSTTFNIAR